MSIRRFLLTAAGILAMAGMPLIASGQKFPEESRKLIFFYSPTCHVCHQIRQEVTPGIEAKFKGLINFEYRDITDLENYKLFLGLQEKRGVKIKTTVPTIYFEGSFLNGREQIKNSLEGLISASLKKRALKIQDLPVVDLLKHFRGFTPFTIVSAGLIDGINPCAFTVIVFFISFLALQGYRKRELIAIGLCFIFAVFLTYLLLGIGAFGFLYRINKFWLIAKILNYSVGAFSIILGFLAIHDFFKFKKTGKTEGLALQLPQVVKNQIHKVVGLHYRVNKDQEGSVLKKKIPALILSALITGFLVSILEAICTGQTYLPTISFILKTADLKLQALGYLLLYNLMFIAPLVAIFFCALLGTSSGQFSNFLKRRLLIIKILMAVLFFGLGAFLIWKA